MKKNALVVFLALSLFWASGVYANAPAAPTNATATGYTPLVKIPGVPDGEVDISKYLIGVYSFLLSIVGIVAVVMLIIGGMKYIMAAGSGGAVSGAKQTITDAIFGLILALLSYVIVSTINPDVLYLRQPGAALVAGKDANIGTGADTGTAGSAVKNPDGSITFTDSDGVETVIRDFADTTMTSAEYIATLVSGKETITTTLAQKVAAMYKNVSCIAPGSPAGIGSPNYHGKCKCVVGGREIPLSQTTVDAKGGCSEECRKKNLCGYKFLSVKLNARHGYSGSEASTDAGAAATTTGSGGIADGDMPTYRLTADTQVHSDEIWEMTQTTDPKWDGDFNITFDAPTTDAITAAAAAADTVSDKQYYYDNVNDKLYPCAILVTNEKEYADDEHWVYWVPLGTVVGEQDSLYEDIQGGYWSNCTKTPAANSTDGLFAIQTGVCDQAWTDRVMLAKYADSIVDKCDFCDLADQGSVGKAYRWTRTHVCRGGYWQ